MPPDVPLPSPKRIAPAAERNKHPILEVLAPYAREGALVLTIAEGTGQHASHFAARLPGVTFQPTDVDRNALASIEAYCAEVSLPNLRPPLLLNASSLTWPVEQADLVICINMIHISSWLSTVGLFHGAARILPAGGALITYGPYRFSGHYTAPSNEAFDASLRSLDPSYGIRDVDELDALGAQHGFAREATVALPANNHVLVFLKRGSAARLPGWQEAAGGTDKLPQSSGE